MCFVFWFCFLVLHVLVFGSPRIDLIHWLAPTMHVCKKIDPSDDIQLL